MGFTSKNSGVWALLIGIDAYLHHPLKYAVKDAQDMHQFLTGKLLVPPNHITMLLAEIQDDRDKSCENYANRRNILSSLWLLHKRPDIRDGDLIIIFYAGHGTQYAIGDECGQSSQSAGNHPRFNAELIKKGRSGPAVEAIVPVDRDLPQTDDGERVLDIADREINAILSFTHRKTGANIVFIADCCHSGGTARSSGSSFPVKSRNIPPLLSRDLQQLLQRTESSISDNVPKVCLSRAFPSR
jgi:hypothetical protein